MELTNLQLQLQKEKIINEQVYSKKNFNMFYFIKVYGIKVCNMQNINKINLFISISKVRAIQIIMASRKSSFYYFYIKKHQKIMNKSDFFPKVLPFLIWQDF